MKIAYLILAHKNPQQVKRLIKSLKGDVFVHIDRKRNLQEFYIDSDNIHYLNNRVKVNWGGYSIIEATLRLIKYAKETSIYDYYILLSGDDYPIRKLDEFSAFLSKNIEYSFMEYDKFDEKWHWLKYRYERYYVFENPNILGRIVHRVLNMIIRKRTMYKGMIAYKGSQWWCLNLVCIEYILKYISENKSVIRFFKHTRIPDEMFFQTILLNSRLKDKIINDNLRYIVLEGRHPETLLKKDFEEIITSNKFFARKFDINIDNEILDLLDVQISS